jgi:hypothetical protein
MLKRVSALSTTMGDITTIGTSATANVTHLQLYQRDLQQPTS